MSKQEDLKIKTAAGKPQLNLVPLRALKGAARVFTYGGKKYNVGNYLKATMDDGAGGRYIGAELRHMADLQGLDGQFTPESLAALDPESGLPHIDHMLCGLIMLRAIMVKDGVLVEDPGEGLEPPTAVTAVKETSTELTRILDDVRRSMVENDKKIIETRVQQGNFDVIPYGVEFGGEFGGCETTMAAEDAAHPVSESVFRGRENDDWSSTSRNVEPFERSPVIRDSHNDYGSYNDYLDALRNDSGAV